MQMCLMHAIFKINLPHGKRTLRETSLDIQSHLRTYIHI